MLKIRKYAHPPHHLRPGTILREKYAVGYAIGEGGFGITYIGRDTMLDMRVAIKEFYPKDSAERVPGFTSLSWTCPKKVWDTQRERFVKEARIMAKIKQIPYVSQVYDYFFQNDTAYIVMAYVEGRTVKDKLKQDGLMDATECLNFFKPVMHALSSIHKQGMVHRDISPKNIMEDKDNRAWLIDLGAAKQSLPEQEEGVSQETQPIGLPGFSPLEQYTGTMAIGPWTDVYALAATVYYCLTGELLPDVIQKKITISKKIPRKMRQILRKGIALYPEDRYQTVDEFEKDWEKAVDRHPFSTKGFVGILLILAVVLLLVLPHNLPPHQPDPQLGDDIIKVEGTPGIEKQYGCVNLFDGSSDTKWCVDFNEMAQVTWKYSSPTFISAIWITPVMNEQSDSSHTPKSWKLYGIKGEQKEEIFSKMNDSIPVDVTKQYDIDNSNAYDCFELDILETNGSDTLELSRLALEKDIARKKDVAIVGNIAVLKEGTTNGVSVDKGSENVFDNNRVTTWTVTMHESATINWKQWYDMKPGEITLCTPPSKFYLYKAKKPEQNPIVWKLWARAEYENGKDEWIILGESNGSAEEGSDYKVYDLKSDGQAFKYYRLEITKTNGDEILEIPDIKIE